MVSDGNGVGTNYMTRIWAGQQGGQARRGARAAARDVPHLALTKTYNVNRQTPDSAPTAGAMNTGVKQIFNTIDLSEDAVYRDCATVEGNELTTFAEMVAEDGKSVGVVSTARITHATPAAVYAKTARRDWEDGVPRDGTTQVDMAQQVLGAMEAGTVDLVTEAGTVDLAMGGGRRHFIAGGTRPTAPTRTSRPSPT